MMQIYAIQKLRIIRFLQISISGWICALCLIACSGRPELSLQQPKLLIHGNQLSDEEKDIAVAFEEAVARREDIISFLIFDVNIDHIDFSSDKNLALLWLSLSDPESGEVLPIETGLVIAKRVVSTSAKGETVEQQVKKNWEFTFQSDPNWEQQLASIPLELLDQETRSRYATKLQPLQHARQVFSGYRLPWAPGEAKYLTGSIGHVYIYKTCPTTCLYAFDFADGSMWPVLASKGGRVRYAVWQHPNGNTKHTNYIVIEDSTTSPTTYQVYMHLAQDSIPVELRKTGAVVVQGQKIGIVDDTGVSTGHHLHFHVHTNPGSYWGTSVDITFDDVRINGGRPRTCNEARLFPSLGTQCQSGNLFTSGNEDLYLPEGDISSPEDNSVIRDHELHIDGWAKDDSGIQSVQIMMNFDGNWLFVGEPVNETKFTQSVDLCEIGVPDGKFFVALKIFDNAGKEALGLPGLRTYTKNYKCPLPPPECTAGVMQIGVFELPEFQGRCAIYAIGAYNQQDLLPNAPSTIQSIQLGEGVISSFIKMDQEIPITQTLLDTSPLNLNLDQISGVRVEAKPPKPQPIPIQITNQPNYSETSNNNSVLISWEITHDTFEYRALLAKKDRLIASLNWGKADHWEIENLEPGEYTLYIDIRNVLGDASTSTTFSILEPDPPPQITLLPLPDKSESTALKVAWKTDGSQVDINWIEIRYRENGQAWKDLGSFPPQVESTWFFGIPGSQYDFQIRGTEISGDVELFHSDPGTVIKIEETCKPDTFDLTPGGDNSIDMAEVIELGLPQEHNICGQEDADWVSFVAEKAAIYRIQAQPLSPSTAIKLSLFGFSSTEPLYRSLPEDFGQITELVWESPSNGIYYIQVTPFDPRLYGTGVKYKIEVNKIVQVHTPGVIISTLIVPLMWSLIRVSKKIRSSLRK